MVRFDIKIYTDTICPWCYIGHKSLDKAIGLYKKTYPGGSRDDFVFTFSPYYLDPTAPKVAIPWEQRVVQKNGDHMLHGIRTRLERVGRENGIQFNFESKIGSTRDSHRLLQHARQTKGPEAQKQLLEEIFEWHFEQGGDITSHEGLTRAATTIGLPEDEISAFLLSDAYATEVDALASQARQKGVYSVPTIEINGKKINVEGAGDVSEFFEALINARPTVEPHDRSQPN
ncbi:hypothetical protein M409DRAFT_28125 [Zasmidium cellare ATCC 36951]|uniref:DSBA-like thioredoxin domain-containing protein n=1 Tax=Zasmidium cellare ATCC 36951 TaxID=1080233 RepID=A0A6A6C2W6_ZASCE|nr:uncharacterized protein M409DRAFT_28125 [Zasmidium cellare ATCC 36951]KAF2161391.1 hypothetical protein M409DRAFT_28125 [Zasmidium cellare ATCC 36951]